MSKPVHTLITYWDGGGKFEQPWRVSGKHRDGPATSERLSEFCEPTYVSRAVIVRYHRLQGPSWGLSPVVVATYVRDPYMPTATQERLIERIGSRPGVAAIMCDPQPNGDVKLKIVGTNPVETVVYRHPTMKELIYEWPSLPNK